MGTALSKRGRKRSRRRSSRAAGWLRRRRSRWLRVLKRAPWPLSAAAALLLIAVLWLGVNWAYQVVRKPSELFFPVSGTLYKSPADTWATYALLFRSHATPIMTPDLLAALAQVEGAGNPVARTYWRWTLTSQPFEIYRPASSAVGMYQMTDGTFATARRYCVHDHAVAEEGGWLELHSCWFNSLYTRVVPSHAIELAAAYLDRTVTALLARHPDVRATFAQKQRLAALAHLCGAGAADTYVRRGLRLVPGQRCGAHDAAAYLARVRSMQHVFAGLADEG